MRFAAAAVLACLGLAAAQDEAELNQRAIQGLEAAAERMERLRPLADRTQFEFLPAVEALDFDGGGLAEHVAENIRYEPYQGILRGAVGTLSAGGGNSVDQSLLLVALLEEAGYDAEILYLEETSDALKPALTDAALASADRRAAVADASELDDWLDELPETLREETILGEIAEFASSSSLDPAADAIQAAAERLGRLVPAHGDEIEYGAYHWVRYRLASGTPWEHAHPALGGAEPPDLEPDGILRGTAPEDMLHFVTIGLHAEILEDGELRETPLMSEWRQPVATLFDSPISVALAVEGDEEGVAGARFTPVLNGDTPPGAQMTTLTGAMIDQGVLDMDDYGMAGVFTTLGDQMQGAAEQIGGHSEDQPLRATTAIILRVTWTAPDGEERTDERYIVDRLANRFDDEAPRLDQSTSAEETLQQINFGRNIWVNPGGAHAAFAFDRAAQGIWARLRQMALTLQAVQPDGEINEGALPQPLDPVHMPLLTAMATAMDAPLEMEPDRAVFRHGPVILALHQDSSGLEPADENVGIDDPYGSYIDVMMNPWTGLRRDGDRLASWPQGAVLRGAHDTGVELVSAGEDRDDWSYFTRLSDEASLIGEIDGVSDWPNEARTAAERDIEQGFTVVELAPLDSDDPLLWWRLNPLTGEILGRHARGGYAQSYTEYGVLQSKSMTYFGYAVSAASFGNSMRQCFSSEVTGAQRACCVSLAVGMAAAGGVAGSAAGNASIMSAQWVTWGQSLAMIAGLEVAGQAASAGVNAMSCGRM